VVWSDQDRVFGFGSLDGRVPGESLTCYYVFHQARHGDELAQFVSGTFALVVRLPLVGEA